MAHFAELDETNTVLRVIVVGNQDCLDSTGQEAEAAGIFFCQSLFGPESHWLQTSYNNNFRGKYAAIGDIYDPITDTFITPEPALEQLSPPEIDTQSTTS